MKEDPGYYFERDRSVGLGAMLGDVHTHTITRACNTHARTHARTHTHTHTLLSKPLLYESDKESKSSF